MLMPDADLWGSNPFHHFTDRKGRPGTILFGWHPGQKLTNVVIPDLRAVVLSAETPHFSHPGEQLYDIDRAVHLGARQALDLIKKVVCGDGQTGFSFRVVDPPFRWVLPMVAAFEYKRQNLNETGRGFGDLPFQIGDAMFAAIKGIDIQELKPRHLVADRRQCRPSSDFSALEIW